MCGIVAYWPVTPTDETVRAFQRLCNQSTIRGLHAFGFAQNGDSFRTHNLEEIYSKFNAEAPAIAHARYCTSGDWRVLENNQPIDVGGVSLVFNGVIHMGTKEEFEREFDIKCNTDNDGEIFLRRGQDPLDFLSNLKGSFAGAWLITGEEKANSGETVLCIGRNSRRPLWSCAAYGAIWYASTKDIFLRADFPHTGIEEVVIPEGQQAIVRIYE